MNHQTPFPHDMTQTCRSVELLRANALACLLALLSACGGRTEQTSTDIPVGSTSTARTSAESTSQADIPTRSATEISAQAGTATSARRGVLLAGLPGDNAYAALQAYVVGDREVSETTLPAAALTHTAPLNATLDLAATIGQVNAALSAVGARIVAMQPGHKTLAIELTTSGTPPSNRDVAASLIESHAFQWVQGPGLPVLPGGLTADPAVSEPTENLFPRTVNSATPPRPRSLTDTPAS